MICQMIGSIHSAQYAQKSTAGCPESDRRFGGSFAEFSHTCGPFSAISHQLPPGLLLNGIHPAKAIANSGIQKETEAST
jgi:hypothetical protein